MSDYDINSGKLLNEANSAVLISYDKMVTFK